MARNSQHLGAGGEPYGLQGTSTGVLQRASRKAKSASEGMSKK